MNLLMVGAGKGSWEMRGQQLGAALGARVTSAPTVTDWHWADVVVLVKRALSPYAAVAQSFGVPIVWDALDFWRQPDENVASEDQALALLRPYVKQIAPALIIGATAAMADDCDGVYLSHHSWAGLSPTPAREAVRVVAYQGSPLYLGSWAPALDATCKRRGWTMVINPPDLSAVDIIVALRGGQWDGWMCREWKSGVKLVNAIAAGRPVITQPSAAARELSSPGSTIETVAELETALDAWTGYEARQAVVGQCQSMAPAYRVDAVADRYAEHLMRLAVAA